jgi:hypothetical protein
MLYGMIRKNSWRELQESTETSENLEEYNFNTPGLEKQPGIQKQ